MLKKLGAFLVLLSVSVFFLGCGGKTGKSPTKSISTPASSPEQPTPPKTPPEQTPPKTTPES